MTADSCCCSCTHACFSRVLRQANRRSCNSQSSSNPHAEQFEVLASSVEWLQCRVEVLLSDDLMNPPTYSGTPSTSYVSYLDSLIHLPRQYSTTSQRTIVYSSDRTSMSLRLSDRNQDPVTNLRFVRKRREQTHKVLFVLLKKLQSATRNPVRATVLVEDDDFCHLLPLAISSSFYDMQPNSELLLGRTLANLSCHRAFYTALGSNNFLCNLIDGWTRNPCLVLSLCGRKIAANLSTYTLLATLNAAAPASCIYQPDVYELARPYLTLPSMDVVFVNGMMGSVFFTWKQGVDDSVEGASLCWPRDWLMEDLPKARILALNMKISVLKWRGCSSVDRDHSSCLPRRASEALSQLVAAGVGNRLTAFVCHSFGGLIVKQMLQLLHANKESLVHRKFLDNVRGVIFVAVPHMGRSKVLNISRCYWRPLRRMCLSDEAKNVFDGRCRVLNRLHAWFVQYVQTRPDMRVLNLIELAKTTQYGVGLRICPETLADKLVGGVVRISLDHIFICKPPTRDHESYTAILNFLSEVSALSTDWRPALLEAGAADLAAGEWRRPLRNCEEELRLRYGVTVSRALLTNSAWSEVRSRIRGKFYDRL